MEALDVLRLRHRQFYGRDLCVEGRHEPGFGDVSTLVAESIQHGPLAARDLPEITVHEDHTIFLVGGKHGQQLGHDLDATTTDLGDP